MPALSEVGLEEDRRRDVTVPYPAAEAALLAVGVGRARSEVRRDATELPGMNLVDSAAVTAQLLPDPANVAVSFAVCLVRVGSHILGSCAYTLIRELPAIRELQQ